MAVVDDWGASRYSAPPTSAFGNVAHPASCAGSIDAYSPTWRFSGAADAA